MHLVHQHVQRPRRPRPGGAAASTTYPKSRNASTSSAGSFGAAPSVSRLRTIRPLVALLKWLTTFRVGACSTRTVAVRPATSPFGFHAAAYAAERRSRTSPDPAASGSTSAIGVRQ